MLSGVSGLWNRARSFGQQYALILLYHRVADLACDPWAMAVSPHRFEQHMRLLQQVAYPVSLATLVEGLQQRQLPKRAVAITFDDGYADNLEHARPVLARYGLPATVFVPTCAIDSQREYWWDALEQLLLQPGRLPRILNLSGSLDWDLGDDAVYSAEQAQRYHEWRAPQAPPTARHRLFQVLWERMHTQSSAEQTAVLAQLFAWAGLQPQARATHRTLSSAELRCLAKGGLITIGGHTRRHPSLAALPRHEQRMEIGGNKADLEQLLEQPAQLFAYPFGKQNDFTPDTVASVREAGFAAAVTNLGGAVTHSTDRFQLPRRYVHNWDIEEFQRRLEHWFTHPAGTERRR
ncbi:MAG TPA: polysaccharide deacetylase family protein [Roseiflexaceae bacterium]|nr:polysaccharide deacetylase family protein [Roseiflexaceae bacterium]